MFLFVGYKVNVIIPVQIKKLFGVYFYFYFFIGLESYTPLPAVLCCSSCCKPDVTVGHKKSLVVQAL